MDARETDPMHGRFLAIVVLPMAAVCGCVTTAHRDPAEAIQPTGHAAVQGDVQEVQVVRYRFDEGFVPARLDVETGTRVVLVNESGEPLTPRFAVRHGHAHSGDGKEHHGAHGAPADSGQPAWAPGDPQEGGDRWAHSFDVSGYWRYSNELKPDHSGLVVALPPLGDAELEPLAMERYQHSFPDPPRPTVDEYSRLLHDQEDLRRFMNAHGPANTLEVLRRAEI